MKKKLIFPIFLLFSIIPIIHCQLIDKVVIPAAGLGTRLLPFTKVVPKEMMPLGSKPAIQFIIEEAMDSGVSNIITIISKHKMTLQSFFDPTQAIALNEANKDYFLADFHRTFRFINFSYLFQEKALGLGHAVMLAQEEISDNYFGVMLPDDIIFSGMPSLKQLTEIAQREQASVIGVMEVPVEDLSLYGVVSIKKELRDGLFEVADLVEKPAMDKAPSRYAIIGRYVLSPKVFNSLKELYANHKDGELQLTDAIAHMLHTTDERVLAYKVEGEWHDLGVPLGLIKATIAYALYTPEYQKEIIKFMKNKIS
jgi:UTP--glucose-1-phosphate uridylyltransferase